MKSIRKGPYLAAFALSILAANGAHAQSGSSGHYIVCFGSDAITKRVYSSRVWFYNGTDNLIGISASSAFINYINGNVPGAGGSFVNPICESKDDAGQAENDANLFKSQAARLGYTVINTGWSYGGSR